MKTVSIANELVESQKLAKRLFSEIDAQGIIRAGRTETAVSADILALGESLLGAKTHWHKRVIRAGKNATLPFNANPSELLIKDDDLVYIDLGPVFGKFEADFGDTFQLGNCPDKARLVNDLKIVFQKSKDFYMANPNMTGNELYEHVNGLCNKLGWKYGNNVAGTSLAAFHTAKSAEAFMKTISHPQTPAQCLTMTVLVARDIGYWKFTLWIWRIASAAFLKISSICDVEKISQEESVSYKSLSWCRWQAQSL